MLLLSLEYRNNIQACHLKCFLRKCKTHNASCNSFANQRLLSSYLMNFVEGCMRNSKNIVTLGNISTETTNQVGCINFVELISYSICFKEFPKLRTFVPYAPWHLRSSGSFVLYVPWSLRALLTRLQMWQNLLLKAILKNPKTKFRRSGVWATDQYLINFYSS